MCGDGGAYERRRLAAIIVGMTGRFDELVLCLEAAREVADRLVVAGENEFVPVLANLCALVALPRDDRFPIEAMQRRWKHMPFVGERGGGYTGVTTPLMEELARRLDAVVPAALTASPELQREARRASDPLAGVVRCHGHLIAALKSGAVMFDDEWLVPLSSSEPPRLFLDAPEPQLVGQTGLRLWIADLGRTSWACVDVAPGTAHPYSFLDALVVDQTRLAYDLPVLATRPQPRLEYRRKEVRLADIAWSPCPRADSDLIARCRRARWDDLFQLLAAYFGDQAITDGVSELVLVTAGHHDEHVKCLGILDAAIAAVPGGDPGVLEAIERSFAGSARDADEGRSYLEGLRAEYLRQYELAIEE
jgi:hypothetical protein